MTYVYYRIDVDDDLLEKLGKEGYSIIDILARQIDELDQEDIEWISDYEINNEG